MARIRPVVTGFRRGKEKDMKTVRSLRTVFGNPGLEYTVLEVGDRFVISPTTLDNYVSRPNRKLSTIDFKTIGG